MKNILISFLVIFFSLLLISCKSSTQKESSNANIFYIKQEFYNNGSLKIEDSFNKDSLRHGKYKKYYENGQLELEIEYENGQKHGYERSYYENGRLKSEHTYANGLTEGTYKFYYENGKIEMKGTYHNNKIHGFVENYYETGTVLSVFYYKEGIRVGVGKQFHPNGDLQIYILSNPSGEIIFRRDYDEDRKITHESGNPILIIVEKEVFKVGETVWANIMFANLPDCKSEVFTADVDNNGKLINLEKQEALKDTNIVVYKKSYDKLGNYQWKALLRLTDININEVTEYESFMDVTVVENL